MSNNIYDDTVSEKAIWEGSITPDNETPSFASQMQSQPQMMFCYKCNQVIPGNSTYCPYCQVKLFTECPKCGAKYSSQYPSCSQCGTNREEFLQRQREWEWKQAEIERKTRLEQEKKEKEKQEKEKAYRAENAEIIKTEEYKSAYALFVNAFKALNKITTIIYVIVSIIIISPNLYSMVMLWLSGEYKYLRLFFISIPIFCLLMVIIFIFVNFYFDEKISKKIFLRYISKRDNYDKDIITPKFIKIVNTMGEYKFADYFPDYYVISYRRKNKMPIYKSWHSFIIPDYYIKQ